MTSGQKSLLAFYLFLIFLTPAHARALATAALPADDRAEFENDSSCKMLIKSEVSMEMEYDDLAHLTSPDEERITVLKREIAQTNALIDEVCDN